MLTIEDINEELTGFDKEFYVNTIVQFIREYFEKAGVHKAVIGVSGGVDSGTTLALTVEALGADRVIALLLPHRGITPEEDMNDALNLIKKLGVEHYRIDIKEVTEAFKNTLSKTKFKADKKVYGNIMARTRMIYLYAIANINNALVVGCGDKSEILIGYFTKYGDGGVDLLPIGDVYKTQVRLIAQYLGVPDEIALKPSSPRLWPGQEASSELGADYSDIDPILYAIIEKGMRPDQVKMIDGIRHDLVDIIVKRIVYNEHKRQFPKIPKLQYGPTVSVDWKFPLCMRIFR